MSELAATERALLTALGTIAEHWAALVEPSSGGGSGGTASSDVVTGLDRRVSLRHEVTLSLNGWARLIVEERNLQPWNRCNHGSIITLRWPKVGPTLVRCAARVEWAKDDEGVEQSGLHPILGTDTLGLVEFLQRWARWFSGHEAAEDAVEELSNWANEVRATAAPTRRDWVYMGDCPFVVEDWFCHGQVRGYGDPDRLPACTDCGQEAVSDWWEEVLDLQHDIDRDGVSRLIATVMGRTVSRFTLTRWISSGRIPKSGTNEAGEDVFDRRTVAAALTRQHSA